MLVHETSSCFTSIEEVPTEDEKKVAILRLRGNFKKKKNHREHEILGRLQTVLAEVTVALKPQRLFSFLELSS